MHVPSLMRHRPEDSYASGFQCSLNRVAALSRPAWPLKSSQVSSASRWSQTPALALRPFGIRSFELNGLARARNVSRVGA